MDFEQELPERLRASVRTLQPDLTALVADTVAQGERVVRRRRVLRALGACGATLAVLAGGGIYLSVGPDGPATDDRGVAVAGLPGEQPAGRQELVQITPQATLRLLLDELPVGARTGDYRGASAFTDKGAVARRDFGSRAGTEAQLSYTDADGTAAIWVRLDWGENVPDMPADCDAVAAPGDTCEARTLADDSVLVRHQTYTHAPDAGSDERRGPMLWRAWLIRPDGLRIVVSEVNAKTRASDAPVSRPTPPLSLDQLQSIVTSRTWQTELSADEVKRAAQLFTAQEEK
ncbi:hypothetical protein [Flindersiella endophytica]